MQRQRPDGYPIGTFDGLQGDQRGLGESKNELSIRDLGPDDETGEIMVELVVKSEKPVDTPESRTEIPEHGIERMIAVLESILAERD